MFSHTLFFYQQIRHLRNVHHIHTQGSDIPDPLKDFAELKTSYGVKDVILTNIESQGYTEPTGVQRQAIPIMIQVRMLIFQLLSKI